MKRRSFFAAIAAVVAAPAMPASFVAPLKRVVYIFKAAQPGPSFSVAEAWRPTARDFALYEELKAQGQPLSPAELEAVRRGMRLLRPSETAEGAYFPGKGQP